MASVSEGYALFPLLVKASPSTYVQILKDRKLSVSIFLSFQETVHNLKENKEILTEKEEKLVKKYGRFLKIIERDHLPYYRTRKLLLKNKPFALDLIKFALLHVEQK